MRKTDISVSSTSILTNISVTMTHCLLVVYKYSDTIIIQLNLSIFRCGLVIEEQRIGEVEWHQSIVRRRQLLGDHLHTHCFHSSLNEVLIF